MNFDKLLSNKLNLDRKKLHSLPVSEVFKEINFRFKYIDIII